MSKHVSTHTAAAATFVGILGSRLVFSVPSSSGAAHRFTCRPDGSDANCTCKGFTFRRTCGMADDAPALIQKASDAPLESWEVLDS
jgi:hypothetical protein